MELPATIILWSLVPSAVIFGIASFLGLLVFAVSYHKAANKPSDMSGVPDTDHKTMADNPPQDVQSDYARAASEYMKEKLQ